jgi:hypothetical protein
MLGSMLTSIQSLREDVNLIHEVREASAGRRLVAFGRQLAGGGCKSRRLKQVCGSTIGGASADDADEAQRCE